MGSRFAALAAVAALIFAVAALPRHGAAESPFGDANADPAPFNPQMSALMNILIQCATPSCGSPGRRRTGRSPPMR